MDTVILIVRLIGIGLGVAALVWCIVLAIRAYRDRHGWPF